MWVQIAALVGWRIYAYGAGCLVAVPPKSSQQPCTTWVRSLKMVKKWPAKTKSKSPKAAGLPNLLQELTSALAKMAPPTGTGSRAKKSRRRRRNRKDKYDVFEEFPGTLVNERKLLNPGVGAQLAPSSKVFVNKFLNPAGEFSYNGSSSRIPDAAVPNSAVLECRQVSIVRCPGLTEENTDLSSKQWNLTIIRCPFVKRPYILWASPVNVECVGSYRVDLINYLNASASSMPTYPTWTACSTAPTTAYVSSIEWTAFSGLNLELNAYFDQFRIINDGLTVFHNAPDLVNQGMLVASQIACDNASGEEEKIKDVNDITLQVTLTITPNPATTPASWDIGLDWEDVLTGQRGSDTKIGIASSIYLSTSSLAAIALIEDESNVNFGGEVLTKHTGDGIVVSIGANPGTGVIPAPQVALGTVAGPSAFVTLTNNAFSITGLRATPVQTTVAEVVTRVTLPPTDTESLIQQSPKGLYMPMKMDDGLYQVGRVFEPQFNMQESNSYSPLRWRAAEVPTPTTGGFTDAVDKNFGFGVIVLAGIGWGASPALKMYRGYEVVASAGSPYMVNMMEAPVDDPDAVVIARAVADRHPLAYPASYNCLGTLWNLIEGVLDRIPVVGDISRVVRRIVEATTLFDSSHGSQAKLDNIHPEVIRSVRNMDLRTP